MLKSDFPVEKIVEEMPPGAGILKGLLVEKTVDCPGLNESPRDY